MANDEPKIHVDDDWKAQARAEKEKLAAEQAKRKAEGAPEGPEGEAPGAGAAQAGGSRELPSASFTALVNTIASQTLFALGAVPDPATKKRYVDLDLARFHIDTLKVLDEKTAGNLSDEEKSLLDNTTYELRSSYLAIARQLAEQMG